MRVFLHATILLSSKYDCQEIFLGMQGLQAVEGSCRQEKDRLVQRCRNCSDFPSGWSLSQPLRCVGFVMEAKRTAWFKAPPSAWLRMSCLGKAFAGNFKRGYPRFARRRFYIGLEPAGSLKSKK